MKINKKLLVCAILALMVLLCVNVASAQDLQDTNLTADDADDVVSVDLDNDQVQEVASESDAGDAAGIEADEDVLTASGDTITVDSNGGGDYRTISEAVSAASGGETIFIKNGNYAETAMKITKDLSFVGESSEGVILSNGEELAKEIPGLVSSEEPEDEGNVVTPENFFEFFDDSGMLLDESFETLVFKGEFKDLGVGIIYLLSPITIIGDGAVFEDTGFCILESGVNLINITINVNEMDLDEWGNEGAVIYAESVSDVVIDGVNINYVTPEDVKAFGIYLNEVIGAQIINSNIVFDANNNGEAHTYALHIRDCEDVTVENNTIDAILPSLDVDFSYWGSIDTDLVLAVGIQGGEDISLIRNRINTNVKSASGMFATLDTIMVYGTKGMLISYNNITEVDVSGEGIPGYSNVVDLYSFNGAIIEYNNIYVKTTTGVEGSGTAYTVQATGPYSGFVVDHNNLTAIGRGPALGIYSQNYYGTTDITVTDNIINVTGLATGDYYALVSGMELQDTVVKVYNNTIYSYNIGEGTAGLFGISYAQSTSGRHSFDVQNNTIYTEGEYAVYFMSATDSKVIGNTLYADTYKGDAAVKMSGSSNVIENNTPVVEMTIVANDIYIGANQTVSVTVVNATGSVTIKINNKEFTVNLEDGIVSQEFDALDLVAGENTVSVTYNGGEYGKLTKTATFNVLDGVITNETYSLYFDGNGNLKDIVPEGATLDFQGLFAGAFTVKINKPVNIISTTGDAVFDSESKSGNSVYSFNVVAGADHTNITGMSFKNYCLYIQGASYVTVDNCSLVADVPRVGSGTGFLSIHSNAYYTTVKNCYMENGGTGSSVLVLGKGGKYASFDNNVINITGSSGNVLSSNVFVGTGDNPEFVNYTNNVINSNIAGSSIMYGITVCGQGNVIENNTLNNFKGNGIVNQFGATSTKNVYRNNTITGGGSMAVGTNSIVENNNIAATVTITAGCTATGNTVNGLTISGANAVVKENTVNGAVTISGANVEFANNTVTGTVTVSSNGNTIENNTITSTGDYSIDLKTSKDNKLSENMLIAKEKTGDAAIKGDMANNEISYNYPNECNLTVSVENITVGSAAVINVSIYDIASSTVQVIVDGKKYDVEIVDGKAVLEVPGLVAGEYNVGVTYDGDDYVLAGSAKTAFTVSKIKSDIVIETTDLKVGEDVTVSVSIEGINDNVTVIVDGDKFELKLVDGSASFVMSNVTAGNHSVIAVYMGDDTHDLAFETKLLTVEKIATEISLNDIVVNYGDVIPIDFVIGENATGNVFVTINNARSFVKLENGAFELDIKGLPVGIYDVLFSYEGDDKYLPSEKAIKVTVNGFDAGLKAIASDIKVGENATIDIEINSEAKGAVLVILDNNEYAVAFVDGKGKVSIPNLANGTYTATVKFAGDEKYLENETTVTFTVSKSDIPGNINISVDIPEGTTSPEFTIKLPSDATGDLTVSVDGKNYTQALVNGSATIKVENLTVGDHNISVAYSGDGKYDAIKTENTTLNVPKASIPGGENAISMDTPEGTDSPSYSINLPKDATGNLTVTVDGVNYTQALVNGSATVNVPKLASGNHNVTVTYTGDAKYSSISKSTTLNVPEPVVKLTENKNIVMLYSAQTPYKVRVTVDGKAVGAGESVTLKYNGKTYNVKTDKDGYATLKLPNVKPKKAKYTITAEYKGVTVKNTVKVNSIIKAANKKVKKSKKVTKVKVTLKKVNGKVLKAKKLKIKFKGKTYKVKTNKKGVATWKVKKSMLKKLKVGKKYKYKVTYGKDVVTKKITVKK